MKVSLCGTHAATLHHTDNLHIITYEVTNSISFSISVLL